LVDHPENVRVVAGAVPIRSIERRSTHAEAETIFVGAFGQIDDTCAWTAFHASG
jgi:hypothetical protein